ncbi:MAG: hypothetical protein AB1782_11160 [Cyanobacteriota bacterium]
MLYLDMLKAQIEEYSNKIQFLKTLFNSKSDPGTKTIILMQIEHAEIHKTSLNKLVGMFQNAF